jgi:ATP-binding cassette subfamily B protein
MRSLKALNKYFLKYRAKIFAGFAGIVLGALLQVFIPLQIRAGINDIVAKKDFSTITTYALYIVGAAVLSFALRFFVRSTIAVMSREVEFDLRQDFWSHVQKLPLSFFKRRAVGDLIAHATNDISAVRMYAGPGLIFSMDTLTRFIIIFSVMFAISTPLAFYTILPLPFISLFVYLLSKVVHKRFAKIQEKFSELTAKAQETFAGIRVVKSYVRENGFAEEFEELADEYLNKNMSKVRVQAWFMPVLFFVSGISMIIVIWVGGAMVINKELTLGDISAFLVYLGMLIWPLIAFGWVLNIVQQAAASMKRLKKIMDETPEEIFPEADSETPFEIKGEIVFENVGFEYENGNGKVLENLNFKIAAGSKVAFVGKVGCGKTTIANLIPRFFDVTEGRILVDGKDIRDIPLSTLRSAIGFAVQEAFLFSDTIKNNILYGLENGNDDILKKIVSAAELSRDEKDFPHGYDSFVGEKGLALSGGQKQRVSLARALAINPKILILDDALSAVDSDTENAILKNLDNLTRNMTVIIIAHRISTVQRADKIYVLEKGKIVEEGTHEELLRKKGIYERLYLMQALEKELEKEA